MASELSWSSFSSTMAAEEPDLLAQFLGSYGDQEQEPLFWPDQGIDPNFYYWPIQNSCSFSYCNNMESNMMATVGPRSEPMPPYMEEEIIDRKIHSDCKRKIQVCEGAGADSINIESSSRKKVRGSWQAGRSSKKSSKPKKADKDVEVGEEEEEEDGDSFAPTVRSFSYCSSEDEANTSQESNLNSKGKMRAGRGSATDPQSLYARKRRERINERLKILQNLVPNGTKVDISTMLEEAVQYVKFLQVQIKLLSSDELWMFAPIAYNGMNIGIDLII